MKMDLTQIAKEVRKDILLEIFNAKSGHPGGSLSCADILTSIYFDFIKDGDKVVLSKGHASSALYAVLAEKGFFEKDELITFRKINSNLQGHPAMLKTNGVDVSSGSLGQGVSIANGIALAFKMDQKDNFVYVILGDGELQEGQVWEAAMTASHYRLNNLIVFVDYNKLQIDGANDEVMTVAPIKDKFEAFGFYTQEINGHDFEEIRNAVQSAKLQLKPSVIIANTIKGKGVSFMENKVEWHGKSPNEEEYNRAVEELK